MWAFVAVLGRVGRSMLVCAYGLDMLAIWHVNLDGGRGGVGGRCFLEEMTGGASVCYGGEQ